MDELDYDLNKRSDKTYISKSLPSFGNVEKKVRIATKVFDPKQEIAFAKVKDEIVLRQRDGGKRVITAKFLEDSRDIFTLNLQTYTLKSGAPHKANFCLIGNEIKKFIEFVRHIDQYVFHHEHTVNITDEELEKFLMSEQQTTRLLNDNPDILNEVIKSKLTKEDIVAVGYRREQLNAYRRLLNEPEYFNKVKIAKALGNEAVWQRFFEKNTWFFGYGLGYLFLSSLNEKKLENVVQGASLTNHGKRADAVMKTRGLISSLCFLEIKTHSTKLLAPKPYRSGCWAPSDELAGAVAQVQGTVHAAVEKIGSKYIGKNADGSPSGEEIFNYQPRSFLVIGSLSEFMGEHGVNSEKYRSFELYRKNTVWPEIITFDELCERASYILNHTENN